jgi:hypothetical protein
MTGRKKIQAARTEALSRSVNDHIATAGEGALIDEAEFICECADPGRAERVAAPLDEYEELRTDSRLFLVKPGHADEEVEQSSRTRAITRSSRRTSRRPSPLRRRAR